jgi:hypothetical protein
MRMDVQFPIFVFEKDDRSMKLIETPERVLYHLEAIDIENSEYLFWDSSGAAVCVSVARGAVKQIARCAETISLREAFETYGQSHGLQVVLTESPLDTWRSLQSQVPPKKTLWPRLFRRPKS